MARIRTIKPEFFTSLTVASLPIEARLTFIGLWTHVDDHGRCVDEARLVKAALWPLDDRTAVDVEADLARLAEAGLIIRYVVSGRSYLTVTGWAEHQRVSHPAKSRLPAPPNAATPDDTPPPARRDEAETSEDARPEPPPASPPEELRRTPEDLVRAQEDLRSDQGSGKGSGKGKDHHQRAREDTLQLITRLTGADDDESSSILDKILNRHRPQNPGGYVRTMHRSGDLAPLLAETRRERHDAREAAIRRAALDAQLAAQDAHEAELPQATHEEAAAARAQIRALLGGRATRTGDPAPIGALLKAATA